ncbi:hypothetical protein N8I77_000095 [Diaporthe amygdali]|uniref:FAD-binding PCMH-type domain-containing protein n=1 Tax=Phomopsis amygdali TaxID=1214568 RepID=A0AAD9SNR2_PHOAM|nr:hypothetical protein N8I77_000095 [Diaporthe amygdali]
MSNPRDCLVKAVEGQTSHVKFADEPKFQETDVRPYNLNLPYEPFAVTYPECTKQTAAIIQCAASYGYKVQARSGGHDYTNKALGGANGAIVVDLMYLSSVQVESTGLAQVGPGNKLKDIAEKLHAANGRYMPHGSSPTVGIGGHATVGGLGLHSRLEGTTLDAMQEAEVVLANGSIVRTSSTEHPDLFWAIRGAGASFGIVTQFTFKTKPEPKEVLNFGFTVASTSPASLSASFKAFHQITNDIDLDRRFSAAVVVSKDQIQIAGAFFGPESDFSRINLESRIPGITARTVVAGLSWMEHMNRTFDSISSMFPAQSYFAALDTCITRSTLPSNTSIDNMFQHIQTADAGSNRWFALIDLYGGAVGDVAIDATSLPHREMSYFFTPYAITDSPTNDTTRMFIEKAVLEIQGNEPEKYLSYAGYTSLPSGFVPQQKYWGPNLARLQKIKASIDPNDVFSTPYGVKAG